MFIRFDTIPACDGRTEILKLTGIQRAVKIKLEKVATNVALPLEATRGYSIVTYFGFCISLLLPLSLSLPTVGSIRS